MDKREKNKRDRLVKYLEKMDAGLKSVFGNAYTDAFKLTEVKNAIKSGESFTWKGNPAAERKFDAQLHKYATQQRGGMNLSERVWNLAGGMKNEMERIIQSQIAEGKSADDVSREIRKCLNDPDRSTKTVPVPVRDKDGKIVREPLKEFYVSRKHFIK
jgi:flagellar motility protein MotE (MotC chaperone)